MRLNRGCRLKSDELNHHWRPNDVYVYSCCVSYHFHKWIRNRIEITLYIWKKITPIDKILIREYLSTRSIVYRVLDAMRHMFLKYHNFRLSMHQTSLDYSQPSDKTSLFCHFYDRLNYIQLDWKWASWHLWQASIEFILNDTNFQHVPSILRGAASFVLICLFKMYTKLNILTASLFFFFISSFQFNWTFIIQTDVWCIL